jgi:hypothetical protein
MTKGSSFWQAMLLGAALLAVSATGLAATMYKWTDSEGNVQYTQTPPPKGDFQKVAPPPAPATPAPEAEDAKATEPEADQAGNETAREDAERKKLEASIAKQNCETARRNLEIYTAYRRVMNEKGEIVVLGDDERAAKIKEANDMIKKYCR